MVDMVDMVDIAKINIDENAARKLLKGYEVAMRYENHAGIEFSISGLNPNLKSHESGIVQHLLKTLLKKDIYSMSTTIPEGRLHINGSEAEEVAAKLKELGFNFPGSKNLPDLDKAAAR